MRTKILFILLLFFVTLTCCKKSSKYDTSGLTTVSTLSPEVKAKYFPDEIDYGYSSENLDNYQVTSLGGKGAHVHERPDNNSKILATYTEGTVFSGNYTDKPHWIRIINNGKVVGYIHDENLSPAYTAGCNDDFEDYPTKGQVINDYNNYDNERHKDAVEAIKLADGYYCYEGVWDSNRHRAQPCIIEFNKKGDSINGTYTNEYWHVSVALNGYLKDSTLTLTGTANSKPLSIKLSFARGLWRLTGHGTHGTSSATIPLERIY